MNRPRLLITTDDATLGGSYHVAEQLAVGLSETFEVSFGCTCNDVNASSRKAMRSAGIQIHHFPVSEGNIYRSTFATEDAEELLDQTAPDLVLCVDAAQALGQLALKRILRARSIPYITVINGLTADHTENFKEIQSEALPALQGAEAITFVSRANLTRFQSLFPEIVTQLCVVPNSRPSSYFEITDPNTRAEKRKELHVSDNQTLFLFVARILPGKGQFLCVEALARLRQSRDLNDIRLVLVGDGEKRNTEALDRMVDELGLTGTISRIGPRSDVPALLDASDAFVLTSFAEGMPLSIIEAMAKARPVIATSIDGIPEQVDHMTGILVPDPSQSHDACVEAIAHAIQQLTENPDARHEMGLRARERALQLFTDTRMIAAYESLLLSVSAAGGHARHEFVTSCDKPVSKVDFRDPAQGWQHAREGWEQSGADGIWGLGTQSNLRFPIPDGASCLSIEVDLLPFAPDGHQQTTEVVVEGRKIAEWTFTAFRPATREILIRPKDKRRVDITLLHKSPLSPSEIALSDDTRKLSVMLIAVRLKGMNGISYRLRRFFHTLRPPAAKLVAEGLCTIGRTTGIRRFETLGAYVWNLQSLEGTRS